MSATSGFDLERRAHRLVWYLGYFARRDVMLYSDDKDQISDIDVIGINFDDTLSSHIILIETKSEQGFSSILKLRGLLDYYSSDVAYIIRPNVTPAIIRFAEQLGIRAMHTSRLDEIESELKIDPKDWSLSFSLDFEKRYEGSLKVSRQLGLQYEILLRDMLWIDNNPFYKLKLLKDTLSNLYAKAEKIANPGLRQSVAALIIDLTTLFSVSVLQSAGILYPLPEHQRKSFFLEKLISGKLSSKEKEELLNRTYDFLSKYTRNVLHITPQIRKEDFELAPSYAPDLYDLLSRILKKAQSSKHLPRLFDIYLSIFTSRKELELMDLQGFLNLSSDEFEYTLKFSRDIVYFLFDGKTPDFFVALVTEKKFSL
jgi:hypothetical protein